MNARLSEHRLTCCRVHSNQWQRDARVALLVAAVVSREERKIRHKVKKLSQSDLYSSKHLASWLDGNLGWRVNCILSRRLVI